MGATLRQSSQRSWVVAVGPEWPSTYYHKEMELLLVVYVDDLKMAGTNNQYEEGLGYATFKIRLGARKPN